MAKVRYTDKERRKIERNYAYLDGKHCNSYEYNRDFRFMVMLMNYEHDKLLQYEVEEGYMYDVVDRASGRGPKLVPSILNEER